MTDTPSDSSGSMPALAKQEVSAERKAEEPDNNSPLPQQIPEAILKDLPASTREVISAVFASVQRDTSSPKMDPEVARILVASVDKDNEYKFKYLTQQQSDAAENSKRKHELDVIRHRDRMKLSWPILCVVMLLVVGCVAAGIYLSLINHEVLGSSILSGVFGSVFGYLGGLGTANFFKSD